MTQLESAIHGMNRALSAAKFAAVMLALIGLVLLLGPSMEARLWPVWTEMQIQVVNRTDERMVIDWWGIRHRETCLHISTAFLVKRKSRPPELALISASGDKTDAPLEGITRPPGWQQLRRIDVIPSGYAVVVHMRHQCHALWQTITYIPEVALL